MPTQSPVTVRRAGTALQGLCREGSQVTAGQDLGVLETAQC